MQQFVNIAVLLYSLGTVGVICSASGVSRERRDDADKVIITTIEEPPYVIRNTGRKFTGNSQFSGLIPEMLEKISDKIKLDYELRLVNDGKYGALMPDGKWSGMIGELLYGDADIAAAPITISDGRQKVVDFTEPFETFGTVMLMYDDKEKPDESGIRSMKDLSDKEGISYGIVRDGVTEEFFKNAKEEAYQTMWDYLKENKVDTVEEGVNLVRNEQGKYVFILENATAEYWVDMEPCNLKIVGEKINEKSFGFALKKGINRKEAMDIAIKELKKEGEINELRKRWKRGKCGNTIEDDTNGASGFSMGATGFLGLVVCALSKLVDL